MADLSSLTLRKPGVTKQLSEAIGTIGKDDDGSSNLGIVLCLKTPRCMLVDIE